jgi:hypothetical protein
MMARTLYLSLVLALLFLTSSRALGEDKPVEPTVERAADLAQPVRIMAGGRPIEVEGFAAPFVGDFDGDGKKDLLVGQYALGRLRVYRNVGTNARPKFDTFEWFKAGGRIAGVPICCQVAFTPQLVDFNGDGRTDILTGSGWAGEVFLFRRKPDQTFDEAEVLQNRDGKVRMHRCGSRPRQYNVTALAYDWDDDGDLDLILGHYPLCLVLNEGTTAQPKFDGGRLIECNGETIRGGLAAAQMADWDGDGLDDMVAGARRNIVWYRNVGERGRPKFAPPRTLVRRAASSPSHAAPGGQPGFHHAFCVADFDADGRQDLLVGDRFRRSVEVDEEARQQVLADDERCDALRGEYEDLRQGPQHETRPERIERYRKLLRIWQEYEPLRLARLAASGIRIEHRGYVWYYKRTAAEVR